MDGWMDGWMVGWMDGWMDGWIEELYLTPSTEADFHRGCVKRNGSCQQRL